MFIAALILAIPTACVAWTIAETELFRDSREALAKWARARNAGDCEGWRKWVRCKLSYLPTCYYCTAHWVGLLFFACHPFTLLSDGFAGYIIAYFCQTGVAVVYLSAFHLLRAQIRKTRAEADLAEKGRPPRPRQNPWDPAASAESQRSSQQSRKAATGQDRTWNTRREPQDARTKRS